MVKWIFDRTTALLGLIVFAPLIGLTALAIKIRMNDGPVLYKQKRIGQYGKPFTLIKFRTMRMNSGGSVITVKDDDRITPLGKILRRYKLDEFPQLWNVLKCDMSFVGPRPDVEGYADALEGEERKILSLKPGITGPATLKYRYEEELLSQQDNPAEYNDKVIWPDKVRLNLEYAERHSLRGDLMLIFKTIGFLK